MADNAVSNPFAVWHGMDRTLIDWHPTIDENKCTGCGMCVVTCGEKRNVFGYDLDRRKAVVMNPENCMVGCNNCSVACLWNAISFPSADYVREMAKKVPEERIKMELQKKFETNPALLEQS